MLVSGIGSCTDTDIVIPKTLPKGDKVTSIGNYAFSSCTNLTKITIPNSVTSIGEDAFYDCTNLKKVYYEGTSEQWSSISIGSNNVFLTFATRYYFSETEPTKEGYFWHYVDGVVTIWGVSTSNSSEIKTMQVYGATDGYSSWESGNIATVTKKYFAVSFTMNAAKYAGIPYNNGTCGLMFGDNDDNCVLIPYDGGTTDTHRMLSAYYGVYAIFGKWWGTPDFGATNRVDISQYVNKDVTILVLGKKNDDGTTTFSACINGKWVTVWGGDYTATGVFNGRLQWAIRLSNTTATVKFTESDSPISAMVFG